MKTFIWHFTSIKGFYGIISSKELWLSNTMTMNDRKDRLYGQSCILEAINTCGSTSILYKYKDIYASTDKPFFEHYSMSFCLQENPELWSKYANDNQGVALLFDASELKAAIQSICSLDFSKVLYAREISYGIDIGEIENTCNALERDFLEDCHSMHRNSRLVLIKKLLFQIYSGYTKENQWKKEEEYRLCYVDESSSENPDASGEILRLLRTKRKEPALSKIGLAPHQRDNNKYKLKIGNQFTSSVLPFVKLGAKCSISVSDITTALKNYGFITTKVVETKL